MERTRNGMKPTIFIVDDLKSCHVILKIALGKMGCRLVCETSKEKAIAQLPRVRPIIVTTDLTPDPDGGDAFDLIQAVKKYDKKIGVIVISGSLSKETDKRARRRGAAYCFKKPYDVCTLRAAVEELLA